MVDLFFGLAALFFLLFFFIAFKKNFNNIFCIFYLNKLIYFILFFFVPSFFLFLPFLLSHVADRVLLLWPGARPEPLRWESQVQDIGPPETSGSM